MNTDQLLNILDKNLWQPHFYTVTAIDVLPQKKYIYYPFAVIVNTLDHTKSDGGHWQAIYAEKPNLTVEYFCSFGQPISKLLRDYIKRLGHNRISAEKIWIQHPEASSCGLYCLDYIMYRSLGGTPSSFYRRFSPHDFKLNEKEIKRYWVGDTSSLRYKFI